MRKPPKPYQKWVNLEPYQRLIWFAYWDPATSNVKDPALVPWEVYRGRMGRKMWLRRRKSPLLSKLETTGIWWNPDVEEEAQQIGSAAFLNPPVLLNGRDPTRQGLLRLAEEIRAILHLLAEAGQDYYAQVEAWEVLRHRVQDQVGLQMILIASGPPGQRKRHGFALVPTARKQDFRAYCFYLLARLMADGHAWRAAKCAQCNKFFLKVRRDPPGRPSRFCKEECRRNWHNERRKGGTS